MKTFAKYTPRLAKEGFFSRSAVKNNLYFCLFTRHALYLQAGLKQQTVRIRNKNSLFFISLWLMLSVFLQSVYRFHFYHIEQYQLFLFDHTYILSTLKKAGGASLLVHDFLAQFFIYPCAGALITSTLLTVTGFLIYALLRRIDRDSTFVYAWSLLPVFSLLFVQLDFNYFMQGTVAYLMTLLLLHAYRSFGSVRWRLGMAVLCTFLLFWWGGSVAVLFALSVFVWELFSRPSRRYLFLIPCAEVFLLAFLSVRYGFAGEYRFAMLPDMYYQKLLNPSDIFLYMSWISLLLGMTVTGLLRSRNSLPGKRRFFATVAQLLLAGALFVYGVETHGDRRSLKFRKMEYYCRTGQVDKIIAMNRGKISNYLYLCFLNLSLAEKGQLADSLFLYDQKGPQSLFIPMNNLHMSSMLLCDIYYTVGHTAGAMNMAFEANIGSPGQRTGRMIQRLVETNIIYGEYAVAEKYIALLEKSLYYRSWAKGMRRYLHNEDEVNGNPEFYKRRKSLPAENFLFTQQLQDRELISLSVANPANRAPIEYAGAMYLLMKDMGLFKALIDTYWGTEVLPVLPLSFQEAVIVMNEGDPGSWRERGVSPAVIARFERYKKFILENKNKPRLADFVKSSYGDTYWYYVMFKQ